MKSKNSVNFGIVLLIESMQNRFNLHFDKVIQLIYKCEDADQERSLLLATIRLLSVHIALLTKEIPDEELKCLAIKLEALLMSRFKDDP